MQTDLNMHTKAMQNAIKEKHKESVETQRSQIEYEETIVQTQGRLDIMECELESLSTQQAQMSLVLSALTSLVILQNQKWCGISIQHDCQFLAMIEYIHAIFVQHVPAPIIPPNLEAPLLPT